MLRFVARWNRALLHDPDVMFPSIIKNPLAYEFLDYAEGIVSGAFVYHVYCIVRCKHAADPKYLPISTSIQDSVFYDTARNDLGERFLSDGNAYISRYSNDTFRWQHWLPYDPAGFTFGPTPVPMMNTVPASAVVTASDRIIERLMHTSVHKTD